MGNRKESLKKSLGLTEYPWSSDDDDDIPNVVAASTPSRLSNEPESSNAARTNSQAQPLAPSLSPRKSQTRLERDLFWSLLHNPYRVPSLDPARPGPSSYQQMEANDRADLDNSLSNIQRIFAINKLPRRFGGRNYRSGHHSRDSLTLLPDLPGNVKFSAIRKRSPSRRAALRGGGPSHRVSASIDLSTPEPSVSRSAVLSTDPAIDVAPSDDELENASQHSMSPDGAEAERADNVNVEPHLDHEPAEEVVVKIEPDIEVVGLDDVPAENYQTTATEQPPEESEVTNRRTEDVDSQEHHGVKRKRGEHEENDISTVKEFNQSVLRLLECPVCMGWIEPPMSQCRRGHLVCGPCRVRLASCPVCRTAFSSVRNRAMEAVAELLRYPCRHGCGREARLRRRAAHEASCSARRYCCPVPPCSEHALYPLDELHYHFQATHLSILKVGRKHKFSMRVNAEQHDNWLVLAARKLFHLRVDVDVRTWGFVVYVAYIGPRCNAKNYTYEVTVTGQHKNRKLVYTRATHSDLECSSLNVSRQDCFHLTLDQALNFLSLKNCHCKGKKYLDFVVEIKRAGQVSGLRRGDKKREEPAENNLENSNS